MLGGGTKGTSSASLLKYDQTGEPLQQQPVSSVQEDGEEGTTGGEGRGEEMGCSVLTPEQIFSQLSMVLQSRCPSEQSKEDGGSLATSAAPRKQNNSKAKRGREGKTRKGAQQQQTKRAKTAEKRVEKQRQRRRQRPHQPRRRPALVSSLSGEKNTPGSIAESKSSSSKSTANVPSSSSTSSSSSSMQASTRGDGVHVVVISPQKLPPLPPTGCSDSQHVPTTHSPPLSPQAPTAPTAPTVSKTNPTPTDENISVAMETPSIAMETPSNSQVEDRPAVEAEPSNSNNSPSNDDNNGDANNDPLQSKPVTRHRDDHSTCKEKTEDVDDHVLPAITAATNSSQPPDNGNPPNEGTTLETSARKNHSHEKFQRSPPNYELLGRLIGEEHLTSFYRSFHAHPMSEHLNVQLLDPLGDGGSNLHDTASPAAAKSLPRWLQITRKRMHIDPNLGPISLARILVSNTGIVKYQHLFPVIRTVFMHHIQGCDMNTLLSELSPRKVLCPGLPNYLANYSTLGHHPREVRIMHTQTPDCRRFDHRDCPILHIPEPSLRWKRQTLDNMCTKCIHLHLFILRVLSKIPVAQPPKVSQPHRVLSVPQHRKRTRCPPVETSPTDRGASSSSEVESPPPHGASCPEPRSVSGMEVWECI